MTKTTTSFVWMMCSRHIMKISPPTEVCAKYETVFDATSPVFVYANGHLILNPLFKIARSCKGGQQTFYSINAFIDSKKNASFFRTVWMKPSRLSFSKKDTSFNTPLKNTENLYNGFTNDSKGIKIEEANNLYTYIIQKHLNEPYLPFISLITVPIIHPSMNMQSIRKDLVSDFLTSLAVKAQTRLFSSIKRKMSMLIDLLLPITERRWDLIKRKEFIPTHLKFYNYGTYTNR